MPKTIIVDNYLKAPGEVLQKLVEKKIVQVTSYKGVLIFGRHYLTKAQIRDAYKRTKELK